MDSNFESWVESVELSGDGKAREDLPTIVGDDASFNQNIKDEFEVVVRVTSAVISVIEIKLN